MNVLMQEKLYNMLSVVFFLAALALSVILAVRLHVAELIPKNKVLILLVIATYRLSRMVVYEKVFSLFRFLISKTLKHPLGLSLNYLISCPWCTGVWSALFLYDVYLFVPYGEVILLLLAISGLATPFVLISNWLTQRADKNS